MVEIKILYEKPRGCGRRKPGGYYLMASGEGEACCKFPYKLDVCPVCHAEFKPARGWIWIDSDALFGRITCQNPYMEDTCPAAKPMGKVGLLWVGEKFYPTPEDFNREAAEMGISWRLSAVPKGFTLGETWVCLAHRKAIRVPSVEGQVEAYPGIFRIFKPEAIEYVVTGRETPKYLESLMAKGITPVKVRHID